VRHVTMHPGLAGPYPLVGSGGPRFAEGLAERVR
jgi:hypothetical protein